MKRNTIVQKSKILEWSSRDMLRDKKERGCNEFLNGTINQQFNVVSSTRLEIYRGKRDMSEFLAKHAGPDHLIARHKQMIKEAIKIHDNT